jgi:hypothetical protein
MATENHPMSSAGKQVHLIIKQNLNCVDYTPLREAINNYLLEDNGLYVVGGSRAAPFDSFANLVASDNTLVAWVVDADTGELRFYNNPGVGGLYIDPAYDSIAMINGEVSYNINRGVDSIPAAGQSTPGDVREKNALFDVTINKVYSARWKTAYAANAPVPVAVTDREPNMVGATFMEALIDPSNENWSWAQGYSPWFMAIVYSRTVLTNGNIVSDTVCFPCCKIGDSINPKYSADGIYLETVKLQALNYHHFPKDDYQTYTKSYSPP